MFQTRTLPLAMIIAGVAFSASGCFSSSSSDSTNNSPASETTEPAGVSGTAATGAPVVDGRVCLRERGVSANADCTLTTTTNADGEYSFTAEDLESLTYPLRVAVSGSSAAGNPVGMVSVIHDANQLSANITPFTEALLSAANNGKPGSELTSEDIDNLDLAGAQQGLRGVLAQEGVLTRLGIDANVDFINDPDFVADRSGVDALLDLISIENFQIDDSGNFRIQITDMGDRSKRLVISTESGGWAIDNELSNFEDALSGADLDLGTIDSLYETLGALMRAGASEAEYIPLFTENFLDMGDDKHHIISFFVDRSPGAFFAEVESFGRASLEGCTSDGVCNARAAALDAEGEHRDVMDLRVKQENGEWRFHGDQRAHNFSLAVFAERGVSVNSEGETTIGEIALGLQLQLDPTDEENSSVAGATLYADRGEAELTEVASFKECESRWLCQVDDTNTQVGGNMMIMSEQQLADMSKDDGSYVLELFHDENRTQQEASYDKLALRYEPFRGTPSSTKSRFANLTEQSLDRFSEVGNETSSLRLDWDFEPGVAVSEVIFYASTFNGHEQQQYRVKNRYRHGETGGDFDLLDPSNCGDGGNCTMEDFDGGYKSAIVISRDSRGRSYFTFYGFDGF